MKMPRRLHAPPPRGQAMVEFALTIGLFMLVVGGLVQFALVAWSQNTVTQVARDTARWAVTQSTSPCDSAASRSALASRANTLALGARLINYSPGSWTTATSIGAVGARGVGADWPIPPPPPTLYAVDCPPSDSMLAWFVTVRINHVVPIFVPGLQIFAPSCGQPGWCLSSTTQLRMEPRVP